MSSQNQESHDNSMANFTGVVLSLTLVVIMVIISVGSPPTNVVEGSEEQAGVVEVVTDVPLPTETSIPPTIEPTATSIPPTAEPTATSTSIPPTAEPTATEVVQEESTAEPQSASTYDPSVIKNGETLFISCGACHGVDGMGITGLGKGLVDSDFVHGLSDDELVDFIKTGRPVWDADNTTGVDMPPRGGNPTLTDDDILAIIAYIRSLSADVSEESVPDDSSADTNEESVPDDSSADTNEESASAYDPSVIKNGEALFISCGACHGVDGMGITGLGKGLVDSDFMHGLSDDELVDFIKTGRPVWDADNTTGVDMPPRGGNPTLTDDDILAIIAYIRSLSADVSEESVPDDSSADTNEESVPDDSNTSASEESASAYDPSVIKNGEALFISCGACHGVDGMGITGLGKGLVDSDFVHGLSDDELVDFIKTGRPVWDADNTTGVDMPPRGGNPTLTDDDILAIIAYIRSLSE